MNDRQNISLLNKPIRAANAIYYSAFVLYCISTFLLLTSAASSGYLLIVQFSRFAKIIVVVLLVFKSLFFQRYSHKQISVIVILIFIFALSYRASKDSTLLILLLFVIASKDINIRVLSAIVLTLSIAIFIFAYSGYMLGYLNDLGISREGVNQVRLSLGFKHPNALGGIFVRICIALIILNGKEIKTSVTLICVASMVFISLTSDSRTAFIGLLLGYVLFAIFFKIKDTVKLAIYGRVLSYIAIATVAISLYLMINYDQNNPIQSNFNTILSGRLRWMHWYYINYPPGLFGQDITLLPVFGTQLLNNLVLDNSFARLYINDGLIPTVVILGSTIMYFKMSIARGRIDIIFVGLVFAMVYGFGEHVYLNFSFDYFLICFGFLLYGFPEQLDSDVIC